jgi:hypothetical protein
MKVPIPHSQMGRNLGMQKVTVPQGFSHISQKTHLWGGNSIYEIFLFSFRFASPLFIFYTQSNKRYGIYGIYGKTPVTSAFL